MDSRFSFTFALSCKSGIDASTPYTVRIRSGGLEESAELGDRYESTSTPQVHL